MLARRAAPLGFVLLTLALALPGSALVAAPAAPVGAERILEGPAYEPTLAITPAGGIFYTGGMPQNDATAYPGAGWIWASHDNGASWVNATAGLAGDQPLYDNFMTADPATGRVMRASLQTLSVGGNGCMQITWSDDEGRSWSKDDDVCAVTPPFHDHENMAFGKPAGGLAPAGYPSLLHTCLNHAQGTECAVSLDGGMSYLPPVMVFPSVTASGWCGGLNSPPKTDSAGRLFVPRVWCDKPSVAVSEDGGLTFTIHALPAPAAPRGLLLDPVPVRYIDTQVLALAVDAGDNLHVLYTAGDGMPYYLYSRDHGATWSAPRMVAVPGITAADHDRIAIAAGASGAIALVYLATDHAGGYATSDWTGARWDMEMGVLTDAFGAGPIQWTQLNPATDPMARDDCGMNRCTPDEPDEMLPGMYDYIAAQVAPDGRPWVAMVDVCHAVCAATGHNDEARAAVGTLASGPNLWDPAQALAPLTWN